MFFVAILPGSDEPKHDMNSFLKPLVDDLLTFWENRIQVNFPDGRSVNVNCAVGCLACDIPASRKAAGWSFWPIRMLQVQKGFQDCR